MENKIVFAQVLRPGFIIASLLMNGRQEISISDLKKVCQSLEAEFPMAYIDISRNSLMHLIGHERPDMFEWGYHDETIRRAHGSCDTLFTQEYIDANFLFRIPSMWQMGFKRIIQEYARAAT